jgi:acyl-CoA synthetase (AMP-forming)/AMP-acid ligase II
MSLVGHGTWRGTHDDEVAVRDEFGTSLTWSELDRLLNRSVNALLGRDVGPDRRVAVFAENSVGTVVAYLTEILAGCSGVPINYHLRAEECAYILRDSGAGLLFVGPENVDVGAQAAALAGGVPVVAWGVEGHAGVERWEDFVRSGSDEEPPDDLRPLPYLHYTSGTTGFPKGTATPPNLYPGGEALTIREHVEALVASAPLDQGPRLTVGPLYHSGQVTVVKRAVLAGRSHVVLNRFDPEKTLRAIEEFGVGRVGMVPTHFVRLLALPEEVRNRYDVSSLRDVVHTAARCPVDVKQRMIEWLGPIISEGYGATEQGTVSTITAEEWLAHPGSVGKVREGLELHVVDEDGNELGPGEVGRLYFRDLTGFDVKFHNDVEKTESVHLRPGVFTIGEVGYVDDQGYLFLSDRFSDMVISGGVNIYPAEAEQVIQELPGVADVGCIGVADEDLGEVLRALVVPVDPDNPPSAEDLIAQTQARLSKYKCPRSVEFVADLGRMPTGKLNKQDLRKRYERGEVPSLRVAQNANKVG